MALSVYRETALRLPALNSATARLIETDMGTGMMKRRCRRLTISITAAE